MGQAAAVNTAVPTCLPLIKDAVSRVEDMNAMNATVCCVSRRPVVSVGRMDELLTSIAANKERLDKLRPLSPKALAQLEHYYDIELTYTSNAIEGNTLSPVETTLVIEKGITIGGKALKDHLEALDHYDAIRYVRELARQTTPLTESDVRNLHRLVMQRSGPEIAGRYADLPRYVRTETRRHTFPSAAEIPSLMGDFAAWLGTASGTPDTAFAAHRRLVDIHPFNDGNGRTARLLMNLILIRGGYPPVAVRPEDRLDYIRCLQQEQAGQGADSFNALLYKRLDATLGEYLSALQDALPPEARRDKPSGPAPKP
jgi:Fic family protein